MRNGMRIFPGLRGEYSLYSPIGMARLFIMAFILLGVGRASGAQDDFKFETISLEHGLSQNSIFCIAQDSMGFLWFGTQEGLNRYNGKEFTVFRHDPDDSLSLSSSMIEYLMVDKSGVLWIATPNGLNRFNKDTETFTRFPDAKGEGAFDLRDPVILSLCEDSQEVFWAGTRRGLFLFDRSTGRFHQFTAVPDSLGAALSTNAIGFIKESRDGTLWISAMKTGLLTISPDRKTVNAEMIETGAPEMMKNFISCILEDTDGDMWIGAFGAGLRRLDRKTGAVRTWQYQPEKENSISSNDIVHIFEDSRKNIWISTIYGLNRYIRETDSFDVWRTDKRRRYNISQNFLTRIFEDNSGILWIGTHAGGINKLDRGREKFRHYAHNPENPASINNNLVWSLCEDSEGTLWVGTGGGGLNRIDKSTGAVTSFVHKKGIENSIINNTVHFIREDVPGYLWIGTLAGMERFNARKGTFEHYFTYSDSADRSGTRTICCIARDADNSLWLGTNNGLVHLDPKTKKYETYREEEDTLLCCLSNNRITSLYIDPSGTLWVGTHIGLNRYDREKNQFTIWRHDPDNRNSLSNNDVLSIYEDTSGRFWVGTMQGLNLFDRTNNTFRRYFEKDGLPNSVVYGILEDSRKNLWLSTNNGLSCFNPDDETFKNFDVSDGLQSREFNSGAYFKNQTGEMFFGGINGFNSFHPDSIRDNPYLPPVVITSIRKFDRTFKNNVSLMDTCFLTHKDKYLSFDFLALDYRNPEKNQYSFMLEGFDDDWSKPGTRNFATYTNLDPGEYIFRVKGSNDDGKWNEQGASVHLFIRPPVWKTWWFQGTSGFMLVFLFIIGYKARIRNIAGQKRKLERQVGERTRELMEKNQKLESTLTELRETQSQLIQSEKMASLGNLVAGVAHEVNNPNGAVNSAADLSLRCINRINDVIMQSIDIDEIKNNEKFRKNLKVLMDNNQIIVNASMQIAQIVKSLKNFARLDEPDLQEADVHEGLDSTLVLLHHQLKNKISVEKVYGEIPGIQCYPNQLNQVFMNILVNAIQAMNGSGKIRIVTERDDKNVFIHIADSGHGIAPEHLNKIFDPGFTTKGVGVGTGLGLSISYNIIRKHNGTIGVASEPGKGAVFTITIPLVQYNRN